MRLSGKRRHNGADRRLDSARTVGGSALWRRAADSGAGLRRELESRGAAGLIVVGGLLLRIVALARIGGRPLYFENTAYDRMAGQLLAGMEFSPYWPPGLPYYLLVIHRLFGDGLLIARASMLLFYVAFSIGLWALIRRFGSRFAANLAVAAFAIYPSYVRWSFNPSTEYPAAALLVFVVLLTLSIIRKQSWALAIVLGFLLGVFALTRGSSLGLLLFVPAYIVFVTRRPILAVMPLLFAALPVSVWLWKAHDLTGRLVMINDSNAQNFFLSNNQYTPLYNTCRGGPVEWNEPPELVRIEEQIGCQPALEQQRTYRRLALQDIRARPDLFLLRTFNRFRAFFCFPIHRGEPLAGRTATRHGWPGLAITALELCFYWPIVFLAIVFCFNLSRFGFAVRDAGLLLGAAFVYAAPCFVTCSQPRYNFPVVPLFAVFACLLVDALFTRPWRELVRPRAAMFLTLAFFAYIQIEWLVIVATS